MSRVCTISLCTGCVGGMAPELHELRGGLCRAHMEEEVYRDLEGPSTNVSLKQNSSSGVGTDIEGKQLWRKWPGPSDLTLGEHGARCVINEVENRKQCNPGSIYWGSIQRAQDQ